MTVTTPTQPFDYPGLGKSGYVYFDGDGIPYLVNGAGTRYLLGSGAISLGYDGDERTVFLDAYSGRVTVQ